MKRLLLCSGLAVALLALLAAPAWASARTFYVHPSGGNDTANIQNAFYAAVAAGPGSTVQLSAGHFYTNNIVVRNFRGYFRGAGEGRTTIDCLRGLDPGQPGIKPPTAPDLGPFTFLVGFVGGNVSVSDLSLDITANSPVDAASNGGSDVLQGIVFVTRNASSTFRRVAMTAGSGSDQGYNTDEDLIMWGYSPLDANGSWTTIPVISGSESVCDCSLVGHDGIQVEGLTHGSLTVTGSVLDDLAIPCLICDNTASQIKVTHNQMHCSKGGNVILYQGFAASSGNGCPLPSRPAPHCLVCDNHMLASGYAAGVLLEDDSVLYGAAHRLDATVAGNAIVLDNGWQSGGIEGVWVASARVLGNRISGDGLAGIDIGIGSLFGYPQYPGSDGGWQIIGNDVSGVDASGSVDGISTAQILLGPDATHCLVVGGCKPTTVLDQGTKDILINVTRLPLPATASAQAATPMNSLKQMKQLKGMMRP